MDCVNGIAYVSLYCLTTRSHDPKYLYISCLVVRVQRWLFHPAINFLLESSPASILVWWNYTETAICSCYGMAQEDAPVSNSGSLKKNVNVKRRLLLIALICSLCNCFLDMASCCLLNDACQKGFGLRLRPKILGSCSLWENFSEEKTCNI